MQTMQSITCYRKSTIIR